MGKYGGPREDLWGGGTSGGLGDLGGPRGTGPRRSINKCLLVAHFHCVCTQVFFFLSTQLVFTFILFAHKFPFFLNTQLVFFLFLFAHIQFCFKTSGTSGGPRWDPGRALGGPQGTSRGTSEDLEGDLGGPRGGPRGASRGTSGASRGTSGDPKQRALLSISYSLSFCLHTRFLLFIKKTTCIHFHFLHTSFHLFQNVFIVHILCPTSFCLHTTSFLLLFKAQNLAHTNVFSFLLFVHNKIFSSF